MLKELALLVILALLSAQDIKTKEIDDRLVYASFFLGVLLNAIRLNDLLYSLLVTLAVGLILYITGVFALGDLWVGLIIAAWLPDHILGIPIAILALFVGILLGGVYAVIRTIAENLKEWVNYASKGILLLIPFAFNPLAGFAFALLNRLGAPATLSLLFLPFTPPHNVLLAAFYGLVLSTTLFALRKGSDLTKEKEPEEGDIPAEVITEDGKRFPLSLSTLLSLTSGEIRAAHSLGPDGLTTEDVKKLREMGVERIKVKESIPLVPFITAGLVVVWTAELFLF